MQFPITIGLHRSRFLDASFTVVALLAVVATIAAPLDRGFKVAALVAILAIVLLTRNKLLPSVSALRLERDGSVAIQPAGSDAFLAARIAPNASVHPWLTVFRLVTEERAEYTVIALPGSAGMQDLRRLRVFLRWQADFNADSDAGDG